MQYSGSYSVVTDLAELQFCWPVGPKSPGANLTKLFPF